MNRQELVEKMAHAGWKRYCPIVPDLRSDTWKAWIAGMDAALSVAIEDLLGEPSLNEILMHDRVNGSPSLLKWSDINWYLAYRRRSKLERVKTPEERVTVVRLPMGADVLLDAEWQLHFDSDSQAEIYRIGLIQQLKDSA